MLLFWPRELRRGDHVQDVAGSRHGAMTVRAQATDPMQAVGNQDVYWVVGLDVDMDKFKPVVEKLVADTEKEPGAVLYVYTVGPDNKRVDIIERYKDSAAALFHLQKTFGPYQKDFMAAAKLVAFVVYGAPNDDLKKALADFQPTYRQAFAGFLSK